MSEDRREAILLALIDVLKNVGVPANRVFRNRLSIAENLRPAIDIFDGDEEPAADVESYGRGRPARGPVMVDMTPEIYFFLDGTEAEVGPALSALRVKIIKAVLSSETLVALCANGDIRYAGFATGFAEGRRVEAEAGISFAFRYILYPSKL